MLNRAFAASRHHYQPAAIDERSSSARLVFWLLCVDEVSTWDPGKHTARIRQGCQGCESTHLICNPAEGHQLIKNVTRQTTRIGGYVGEWEVTMGIFSSGASAIPASITGE